VPLIVHLPRGGSTHNAGDDRQNQRYGGASAERSWNWHSFNLALIFALRCVLRMS
jgi:hypothetical protein